MTLRLVLAWLHLLALAVGLGGVWARGRALNDSLRHPADPRAIRRALVGDTWWGIAALVWLATGLWRLMAGTEKAPSYYVQSNAFALKMALFLVVLALEIWPATTLMRWRRKKAEPDARDVGRIEIISYVQCALVVTMALAAVTMARGYGARTVAPAAAPASDSASTDDSIRASASPRDSTEDDPPTPLPSGSEVVTPADVDLLVREIAMPLDGVDPTTLHSNFDERRGGGTRQHQALDIMAPRGTPVLAVDDGRLVKLFTSVPGGLTVYQFDPSGRYAYYYAHLDRYADGLKEGMPLARGDLIGYVGSTGNAAADAPHLHFAIFRLGPERQWWKGEPIDPYPLLNPDGVRR